MQSESSFEMEEVAKFYSTLLESSKWDDFESFDERMNACELPASTLQGLSTDAIVKLVIDYPFNCLIWAFDEPEKGLDYIIDHSGAWQELLERDDASIVLGKLLDKQDEITADNVIYAQIAQCVSENLSDSQAILHSGRYSDVIVTFDLPDTYDYADSIEYDTVRTPNNSIVNVFTYDQEWTNSGKTYLKNAYVSAFPELTFKGNATWLYNCHSYAWYKQRTSNNYWMRDPSEYWDDGSYTRVSSPKAGDIVIYKDGSAVIHSAVVTKVSGSNITVVSKWGKAPLFEHLLEDCIYEEDATSHIYYR